MKNQIESELRTVLAGLRAAGVDLTMNGTAAAGAAAAPAPAPAAGDAAGAGTGIPTGFQALPASSFGGPGVGASPQYVIDGQPVTAAGVVSPAGAPVVTNVATGAEARAYTQDQLNAMFAERVARERQQVQAALGLSVEDAKKIIDERAAADRAAMDAATKAATDLAQAQALRNEAATVAHGAAVMQAVLLANVSPARLAMATRLVDCPVGSDPTVLAAAVDKVKAETPEWFGGAAVGAPTGGIVGGTGMNLGGMSPPAGAGAGGTDMYAAGQERARGNGPIVTGYKF